MEQEYPISHGDELILDRLDVLLDRLDTMLLYLDAMNKVMVSIQGYIMLMFFVVSLAAGVYIGLTFWGRS